MKLGQRTAFTKFHAALIGVFLVLLFSGTIQAEISMDTKQLKGKWESTEADNFSKRKIEINLPDITISTYQYDSASSTSPLWEYKVEGKAVVEKYSSPIHPGLRRLDVEVQKTTVTLLSKSLDSVENFLHAPSAAETQLATKCLKVGVPFDLMTNGCGFFIPAPQKKSYDVLIMDEGQILFDDLPREKNKKPRSISIYPLVKIK